MDYALSDKNDNQKKQYESIIEQNNKKYLKLAEEIKNIRAGKEGTLQDRKFGNIRIANTTRRNRKRYSCKRTSYC